MRLRSERWQGNGGEIGINAYRIGLQIFMSDKMFRPKLDLTES